MGGRKRRRRVVIHKKRAPPKVFRCPVCEGFPLRMNLTQSGEVTAKCAYCGFTKDFTVNPGSEPIDAYSKLITIVEGGTNV